MSTPARSRNALPFDENIEILFEEVALAKKWQRPSILLAISNSRLIEEKAAKALENRLGKIGQTVLYLDAGKTANDVVHFMASSPKAETVVFFVSNLDWGTGEGKKDSYRALNLYRELLVEQRIKAVFWLTPDESKNLPRFAPDFWAFRHQVVSFAYQRIPRKTALPAGALIWHLQGANISSKEIEEKISTRKSELASLPAEEASRSMRADILYQLGYFYWANGNLAEAAKAIKDGLNYSREASSTGPLLNGLAILEYEGGRYSQAEEIYKKSIHGNSRDGLLLVNSSVVLSAMNRNQEAISQGNKATKLDPSNPRIWHSLGQIYRSIGRLAESVPCFEKAIELAPRAGTYRASLAICYGLIGRPDEARDQINLARKAAGDQGFYLDICEKIALGEQDEALKHLQNAIYNGQVSKNFAQRDPNLSLLF